MEKLKKQFFDPQKNQSVSFSFNHTTSTYLPVDKNIRYSFNSFSSKSPYFLVKADDIEENVLKKKRNRVSFLFYIKNYSTYTFIRNFSYPLFKKGFDPNVFFSLISKSSFFPSLFCGCLLKKVKGGFVLDLNGIICFMPYSLSEGSRFVPYEPEFNSVQIFKLYGLSLVSFFEREVFFSLIASRNTSILKKALSIFIRFNLHRRTLLIRKKIDLKIKNKSVRLLGFSLKNKPSFKLKLIKETLISDFSK